MAISITTDRTLGLMPWNACNARCAHCSESSSPSDTTAIPMQRIVSLIEEAHAIYGEDWYLSLSGGEVFYHYDMLRQILEHTCLHHGSSTLVTNCFWAESEQVAVDKLSPLVANRLMVMGISYDFFHKEYVPQDRIINAIRAAQQLNLSVKIRSVAIPNLTLSDIVREFEHVGPWFVSFMPMPLKREGRARFLPDSMFYYEGSLPRGRCPAPSLTINSSGIAMSCCNGGGNLPALQLGSIKELSLATIEYAFASHVLLNFLKNNEVRTCLDYLAPEEAGRIGRKKFVNCCDLCVEMLSDDGIAQSIVNGVMNEFRRRMRASLRAKTVVEGESQQ